MVERFKMSKSPIDMVPFKVTGGVCPICEKWAKVQDGKVFEDHGRKKKTCPNSGKPIPSHWK